MARQRSDSGTIPSMETSHDELKDNTIIIGQCMAVCHRFVLIVEIGDPSLGGVGRSSEEEGEQATQSIPVHPWTGADTIK